MRKKKINNEYYNINNFLSVTTGLFVFKIKFKCEWKMDSSLRKKQS